jgi:hypothetical protein
MTVARVDGRVCASGQDPATVPAVNETEVELSEAVEAHCPRSLLIEQVMRRTDVDVEVLAFLGVEPLSSEYMALLGRLLSVSGNLLPAGSPLAVWAGAGLLAVDWRAREPRVQGSVWGEFDLLRALHGPRLGATLTEGCPFEALEFLRSLT